jgi:hypothetical protein
VVAIPGASSVAQLESNVAATEINLRDDEYQALELASRRVAPTVERAGRPPAGRILEAARAVAEDAHHGWQVAMTLPGGKAAKPSVSAGRG